MISRSTASLVTSLLLTVAACATQNAGAGFDDVQQYDPMDEGGGGIGGTASKAGSSSLPISGTTSSASGSTSQGGTASMTTAGSGGKGGSGSSGGKGGTASAGGKGGSAAGGKGGAPAGGMDAGGTTGDPTNMPIDGLSVTFKPESTSDPYDFIGGELAVINSTAKPLDYSTLSVRYYFTNELNTATPTVSMNWAVYGPMNNAMNTSCTGTLVKMPTPKTGADSYIELKCSPSGMMTAGSLLKISWKAGSQGQGKFTQANDWSFSDPSKIVVIDANNIVWGVEP